MMVHWDRPGIEDHVFENRVYVALRLHLSLFPPSPDILVPRSLMVIPTPALTDTMQRLLASIWMGKILPFIMYT